MMGLLGATRTAVFRGGWALADTRQGLGVSRVGPQVTRDEEIPFLNALLEAGSKSRQTLTRAYRNNPGESEPPISTVPAQTLPPAAHTRCVHSAAPRTPHAKRNEHTRERTRTTANDQNRVTGEIVKARLEAMYELPPRGRRPPLPTSAYEYIERGEVAKDQHGRIPARDRPAHAPPRPRMRDQITDKPENATRHR